MIRKGDFLTVCYEGVLRSGQVITARRPEFFGQFVTLRLDKPFAHKNSVPGTITRTISLHIKEQR